MSSAKRLPNGSVSQSKTARETRQGEERRLLQTRKDKERL
jgi:hypothetical protein